MKTRNQLFIDTNTDVTCKLSYEEQCIHSSKTDKMFQDLNMLSNH